MSNPHALGLLSQTFWVHFQIPQETGRHSKGSTLCSWYLCTFLVGYSLMDVWQEAVVIALAITIPTRSASIRFNCRRFLEKYAGKHPSVMWHSAFVPWFKWLWFILRRKGIYDSQTIQLAQFEFTPNWKLEYQSFCRVLSIWLLAVLIQ